MSIRTSIILVISLAMVAGYVFFIQLRQTEEVAEQPPWFYNLDIQDLTRIHIEDGEAGASSFHLGDDAYWHMDEPGGVPVGVERWGGITLLLTGPRSRRLLDENPADLAPYGLDTPSTTIEVDLKDGRSINVLMGLASPDGQSTYAQVEGFPQVFTVFTGWRESLTRLISDPPYPEWYYNAEISTIGRMELFSDNPLVTLVQVNDEWRFNDEAGTPLDPDDVPALVASLARPEQELVVYATRDLVPYGLDAPVLSLFLETRRPDEDGISVISHTIYLVGGLTEDGSAYYAQTQRGEFPQPQVYTVSASWVEGLQALAADPPQPDDAA